MRIFLYYSLGFCPAIFFFLRFMVQWIGSEKRKKSHVTPLFWSLSFTGNLLLALHYFIQCQFPFLLIQVVNGFIAWRNLNLLGKKPLPLRQVLVRLALLLAAVLLLFSMQPGGWMQLPLRDIQVVLGWHLLGIVGALLFGVRFWIQWWQAERRQKSELSRQFWILSIVGSSLALIYFARIMDWVSMLNYSFGLIPYVRNLVLINRQSRRT